MTDRVLTTGSFGCNLHAPARVLRFFVFHQGASFQHPPSHLKLSGCHSLLDDNILEGFFQSLNLGHEIAYGTYHNRPAVEKASLATRPSHSEACLARPLHSCNQFPTVRRYHARRRPPSHLAKTPKPVPETLEWSFDPAAWLNIIRLNPNDWCHRH
ncbi:hypothetical protein P5673_001217 [Acropora cervicornis]|uniref:Uncharacterized protein n=1 Tax=Acropora cervicornis TaxID=6130 RepID=A0AAD9R5S2_ACRCE|nr:hypothetical protein P5673_001217 [Acropora cervicornis]